MDLRDHHLLVPYGWSVAHPGGTEAEQEARVQRLRQGLQAALIRVFEPGQGFAVWSEPGAHGWRASIARRDFRADVTMAVERTPHGQIKTVCVYGTGGHARIPGFTAAASRLLRGCKLAGLCLGTLLVGSLAWFSVGVYNPAYLLAGMLLASAVLLAPAGGASVGGWIAERMTHGGLVRLRATSLADTGFQTDLKRWRAFTRQLSAMRAELRDRGRHQPFRTAPEASIHGESRAPTCAGSSS